MLIGYFYPTTLFHKKKQTQMKTVVLALLGVLVCTFYITASYQTSSGFCSPDGDSRCAAQGNLCCRDLFLLDTCYNPTTHTCTVIEGTAAQRRLCGINDGSCNDVVAGKFCYNKSTHHCVAVRDGQPNAFRLCALTDQACGPQSICYNVANFRCVNGNIVLR